MLSNHWQKCPNIRYDSQCLPCASIHQFSDSWLTDVITDVAEAQRQYKKVLKGVDMVIMISTMLHSIATGNMLPASVKVIVVDISQPTVTKLMDRGTWQALGIVSDVGAFLPMVAQQIKKRSK